MNTVQRINQAIADGKVLTTPIWKGVYNSAAKFEIVEALRERVLKVQLQNSDEEGWAKEITVDSIEWQAIQLQANR